MTMENHPPAYEDVPASHIYNAKETNKYGMLKKKSGGKKVPIFQKKYEQRFVIIHKGWVYYYLNKTSEKPQGKFSLQGFSNRVFLAEEEQAHAQWVFKLYHKKANERTWFFAAENESEMQEWMEAFRAEIDRYTYRSSDLRTSRSMPANPLPSQTPSMPRMDSGPRSRSVTNHTSCQMSLPPSTRSSVTDVTSGFVSDADPDMYEDVDGGCDNSRSWEPPQSPSLKNKPLPPTPGMKPRSPRSPMSPFRNEPLPTLSEPHDDFPTLPPPAPPVKPPFRQNRSPMINRPISAPSNPQKSDQYYQKYYDDPGEPYNPDESYENPNSYDDNQTDNGVYDLPEEDQSYESPCSDREDDVPDITYDDHEVENTSNIFSKLGKPPLPSVGAKPTSPSSLGAKPKLPFGKNVPPKPLSSNKPNFSKPSNIKNANNPPRPNMLGEGNNLTDSGATTPSWKANLKSPTSPGYGPKLPAKPGGMKPPTPTNSTPFTPSLQSKPNFRTASSSVEPESASKDEKLAPFGAHILRKTGTEKPNATVPAWQKNVCNPTENINSTSNKAPVSTRPPWAKYDEPSTSTENGRPGGVKGRWGAQADSAIGRGHSSSNATVTVSTTGTKPVPPVTRPKPTAAMKPPMLSQKPPALNKPKGLNGSSYAGQTQTGGYKPTPGLPPHAEDKPKPGKQQSSSFAAARHMFQ